MSNDHKVIQEAYSKMDEATRKQATKDPGEFMKWFPEVNKNIFDNFDIKSITINVNSDKGDTIFTVTPTGK